MKIDTCSDEQDLLYIALNENLPKICILRNIKHSWTRYNSSNRDLLDLQSVHQSFRTALPFPKCQIGHTCSLASYVFVYGEHPFYVLFISNVCKRFTFLTRCKTITGRRAFFHIKTFVLIDTSYKYVLYFIIYSYTKIKIWTICQSHVLQNEQEQVRSQFDVTV